MICTVTSGSSQDTEKIASKLGANLLGGEIIELASDLGGGKTTFVRGLAAGFGSADRVASPTFTVSKVYKAGKKELHHFDFYRLNDAGIMSYELQDLLGDPEVVVVIEWAEVVKQVLPDERLTIKLVATAENSREISFECSENLTYLMEGIC